MARKVVTCRLPCARKSRALMSLWSSPASFVFVSFDPRLSRSRTKTNENGRRQNRTTVCFCLIPFETAPATKWEAKQGGAEFCSTRLLYLTAFNIEYTVH